MASTFSLTSANSYEGRQLRLSCSQSTNISTNQSTISWTLYSEGGAVNYYSTGPTSVYINGTLVYYSERKEWSSHAFPAARGSVSGTITIDHSSDGSKSIYCSLTTAIFVGASSATTSGGTWYLDSIPRQANITAAPNFSDEDNPTISYSNPAGNSVSSLKACISFTGSTDDIEYRDISKTDSSYTFNLTNSEREILRNATLSGSASRTVYFYIETVIGGNTYHSRLERTLTIVNANPTITATLDVDHETYVLTHSHSTIIKDFTGAIIEPTATALKGASITSITVNGMEVTEENIVVNGADRFEIIATDNRGLSSTLTWVGGTDYTFINYLPVTFSGTVKRHSPTGDQLDISFSGNYFNGSFGYEDNYLNLSWSWREKGSSGSFTYGGSFTQNTDFVISNNTYHSGTGSHESTLSLGNIFDYRKSYEIKISCFDQITDASVVLQGIKGIPVFNWGKDFFNVNGDILKNGQPLDAGDTLPIGAIVEYDGDTVPEGYEEVESSLDYISVSLDAEATISKNATFSGVDIPFSEIKYQRNNSDFNLTNNKVYYNGTKKALIQVNYNIVTTVQGYLIAGRVNGAYNIVISSLPNDLAGCSASASSTVIVEQGDYLTCRIGKASTFSGETVYTSTKLDAYVLRYLE